jgi:hypothetical protein
MDRVEEVLKELRAFGAERERGQGHEPIEVIPL